MNSELPSRLAVSELFNSSAVAERKWETFREGIEVSWIYRVDNGPSAALLRYSAGASVPAHEHDDLEHIFVLSGQQSDEHGTIRAGDWLIHGPGTRHSVTSETGCVVFAIWHKPVRFV